MSKRVPSVKVARTLYDIAHALDSALDADKRVRHVLGHLERIVPYQRSALLEARPAHDHRFVMIPAAPGELPVVHRMLSRFFHLLTEEPAAAANWLPPDMTDAWPWRSHLAVPLVGVEGVLGLLFVARRDPDAYGEDHLSLLSVVASQLAAYLTACRFIAQEGERMREVDAARAEAESANRAKDEFLALLSHELRTPLNSVLSWVKLLRGGILDEATSRHALEVIERNASNQSKLITDLLDVGRIVTGKLVLDVRLLDLVEVIEASIDDIRPAAESKGVRLTSSIDAAAGPVRGDPARLQQALANVLSNALKFTPAGGDITMRLSRIGDRARLTVTDTGKGIAPDLLPHIFQRFRQGDRASTRVYGGLGLGLALVHHLVEAHGGTVHAQSGGEGQGATFTIELPLIVPADGRPLASPVTQSRQTNRARLDGVHVLLVDDDADTREVLKTVLELQGATVDAVSSVRDALIHLDDSEPHVLVSDISMPGEDGFTLIEQVGARRRERDTRGPLPALALTAYARTEDRERTLAAGFQGYLAKPVDPHEFVRTVATLAGRRD
jgi:signal transduction histidine kinase/ActR/RegA family two-component response regulator